MERPAILGGEPAFRDTVPITAPTLPEVSTIVGRLDEIFCTRQITNGKHVSHFEDVMKDRLRVKHAIAVSSCTAGLMLTLRALGITGEVLLPSFTFFATAHALMWNNLTPVFVDCDPETFNMDPGQVEKNITERTSAIMGVHVFGNPCAVEELETIARTHSLNLVFDAAHGLGAIHRGEAVGTFGDAEVFSLSPTKIVVAGEGGVVTTNDRVLARKLRLARDYGNPGNYDPELLGLNGRMTEFNAIVASESLHNLKENVSRRNLYALLYRELLSSARGVSFQKVEPHCTSTYKDFAILIDSTEFGLSRDELKLCLEMENIATRTYFYPPVHKQKLYASFAPSSGDSLLATDSVSDSVICPPMYSHMDTTTHSRICECIKRIHLCAEEIREVFEQRQAEAEVATDAARAHPNGLIAQRRT